MNIIVTPALREHMQKTGKNVIIVEVAKCDNSDLEVTELHPHLIGKRAADGYIKRQSFRSVPIPEGSVLLPNYRLEYDEKIIFDVKRVLFITMVKCQGIKL